MFYSVDGLLDFLDRADYDDYEKYCLWSYAGDNVYDVECEGIVADIDPADKDHRFRYCPFCGKVIKIYKE